MPSAYSSWPLMPRSSGLTWVRKCIRVPFHQVKNGFRAATWRRMKSTAASEVSSSTVSIRLRVNGPVSSIRCVPSGFANVRRTPRGPNRFRNSGFFG